MIIALFLQMYLQVIFNILNVLFPSEVQQRLNHSQSQSSNNFLSSFCEERKEKKQLKYLQSSAATGRENC